MLGISLQQNFTKAQTAYDHKPLTTLIHSLTPRNLHLEERLRWSKGSVLAFGTNPAEAVGFFTAKKNPQHAFLRKGSKAVCPMSHICGM